jgi:hypothetical protein
MRRHSESDETLGKTPQIRARLTKPDIQPEGFLNGVKLFSPSSPFPGVPFWLLLETSSDLIEI